MADLTCYALCDKKLDSGHKALTVMNLLLVNVNAKAVQLSFTIKYFFSIQYDNNNIILLLLLLIIIIIIITTTFKIIHIIPKIIELQCGYMYIFGGKKEKLVNN